MKRSIVFISLLLVILLTGCNSNVNYSISFNSNGGTEVLSIQTKGGSIKTMPDDTIKDGYVFDGWYWDNNTFENPFTADSLLDRRLSSNITVYAKWNEAIVEHTISFETNNGSNVDAITAAVGTSITAPNKPTKTGYIFEGWYSDLELTNAYIFTTMPSTDITLYAKWLFPYHQAITPAYIHNFTTDGLLSDHFTIEGGLLVDAAQSYTDQSSILTKAFVLDGTSKITITTTGDYAMLFMIAYNNDSSSFREVWIEYDNGRTLLGFWDNPYIQSCVLSTAGTHEIVKGAGHGEIEIMYIRVVEWSIPPIPAEDEHIISLNPYNNDVHSYMLIKHGEKIPELGGPIYEGYTFAGWYTDASFITKWDFNTPVTSDIFLVSKWEKNSN